MFRINIVGKQTAKCDGMNVRCKGTFSKNAAGEGKLTLKATDYLEFDEKGAGFGGYGDYYGALVCIAKDAPSRVWFLSTHKTNLDVWFDRMPGTNQFLITANLKTRDELGTAHEITCTSEDFIVADEPTYVYVYVLDGDLLVTCGKQIYIWRRFENRVYLRANGMTSIGGPEGNRTGGFDVSYVSFSSDIRSEKGYEKIDEEFAEEIGRVVTTDASILNAFYAAADSGLALGDFKSNAKGTKGKIAKVYKYTNGVILLSADNQYSYMSNAMYKDYLAHDELTTFPGSEQTLIDRDGVKVTYSRFEDDFGLFHSKTTVNGKTKDDSATLKGETLIRYLSDFPRFTPASYPVSSTGYNKNYLNANVLEPSPLSNGNVIVRIWTNGETPAYRPYTVIIPGAMYTYYVQNYKKYMIGTLLADYSTMFGKNGEVLCYTAPCGAGWLYYMPTWGKCGFTKKHLGDALNGSFGKSAKGYPYLDFENGVAVSYPDRDDAVILTDLEMEFFSVTAKKMNYGTQTTPQLYLKQTVYTEAGVVCNNVQLGGVSNFAPPKYTYNKSEGKNLYTLSPVHANSFFRFVIDARHYSGTTTNPSLGCFDYTYGIDDYWGIVFEEQQKYLVLPMTREGSANRGGLSNVILEVKFSDPKNTDPMRENWRRDLGLPLYDPQDTYQLTDRDFTRAFRLLDGGTRAWMYAEVFYKMAEGVTRDGKSYGFACSEAAAAAREGYFKPSLSNYKYKNGRITDYSKLSGADAKYTVDAITDNAMKRIGWDSIIWRWNSFRWGTPKAYKEIEAVTDRIKNEGSCIVSLFDQNLQKEHTQLAYKYKGSGLNTAFYVRDCNAPYDAALDAANPDATYIAFRGSKENVKAIIPYCTNGDRPEYQSNVGYKYLIDSPTALAMQLPRIPTPLDMGLHSGMKMVLVMIEGDAELTYATENEIDQVIFEDGTLKRPDLLYRAYDGTEYDGTRLQVYLFKFDGFGFQIQGTKKSDVTVSLFTSGVASRFHNVMDEGDTLLIHGYQTHELRGLHIGTLQAGSSRTLDYSVAQSKYPGYYIRSYEGTTELHAWVNSFKTTAYGNTLVHTQTKGLKSKKKYLKPKASGMGWKPTARLRSRLEPQGGIGNRELTVRQAANIFGCSESTVRKYCKDGTLRGAYKVGFFGWRIPRQEMLDK